MAIPKYDEMYADMLQLLLNEKELTAKNMRDKMAINLSLSPEDLEETLPSGKSLLADRLSWCATYLSKAGLISRPRRGIYAITEEGKRLVNEYHGQINNDFLASTYPAFRAWIGYASISRNRKNAGKSTTITKEKSQSPILSDSTPEEAIDVAFRKLDNTLADQLMEELMDHDPAFFERMVVQLLLKMGYSRTNDGHVTPLSGDGGIDGIISEDRLGLSRLYLQAKRWDPGQSVGRPEIQKFSGALRDVGGTKGLFITTAHFTKEAQESAQRQNIVLVDGTQLTKLMIEYGLGVSTVATYEIKRLDSDFFSEDD